MLYLIYEVARVLYEHLDGRPHTSGIFALIQLKMLIVLQWLKFIPSLLDSGHIATYLCFHTAWICYYALSSLQAGDEIGDILAAQLLIVLL